MGKKKKGNTKKNTNKYITGINLFFIDTSAIHSANLGGISLKNGLEKGTYELILSSPGVERSLKTKNAIITRIKKR